MLKSKDAFTMAEMILTIAVVGTLAAFMIPAMSKFTPHRNKALFKKAANVTERIVYEMHNDDEIYPRIGRDGTTEYSGFENTERVVYMGNEYGSSNNATAKMKKFCQIFARKLSTNSDSIDCTPKSGLRTNSVTTTPTLTTADGIAWYLPITDFNDENYHGIYVDVNGTSKGPNCYIEQNCNGKDADIFLILVDKYGNVDFFGDRSGKPFTSYGSGDSEAGVSTNGAQDNLLQETNLFKK